MKKLYFKLIMSAAIALGLLNAVQAAPPLQTCTPEQARAQERWWFFGNRISIDFGTSGTAYALEQNPQAINVPEGATVVSDTNGALQFWVGNGNIYNRNQQVMDNGSGITGNASAVQNVVAFSAPDQPGRYFVVATSGIAGAAGNLYYTEVDMTANSGLGAVTAVKNVQLGANGIAGEQLTAVPNDDGSGHWVLAATRGTNQILAFAFDSVGPVTGTPVVSSLSVDVAGQYGSLYPSPDLTRIAFLNGGTNGNSFAHLLEFDATTGVATELAYWQTPTLGLADPNIGGSGARTAYAADFSPSGDYLYVSQIYPGRLWRYDISSEDSASIATTEEFLGATGTGPHGGGHVRRGPDGAMWVAHLDSGAGSGTNWLTRIENPDAAAVVFSRGNIPLPAGTASTWGLPQIVAGCAGALPPAEISVTKTVSDTNALPANDSVTYTITVENIGTSPVVDAVVQDTFPPGIASAEWTCSSVPVGLCPNADSGGAISAPGDMLNETVSLLTGERLEYLVTASTDASPPAYSVNTVSVTVPGGAACSAGDAPQARCVASAASGTAIPVPVPVNHWLGLLGAVGLMVWMGRRQLGARRPL